MFVQSILYISILIALTFKAMNLLNKGNCHSDFLDKASYMALYNKKVRFSFACKDIILMRSKKHQLIYQGRKKVQLDILRDDGNISFLGMTLLITLSLFSILVLKKDLIRTNTIAQRVRINLCIANYENEAHSYIKRMELLNLTIVAANTAMLAPDPVINRAGHISKKISQYAQDALHISFKKNIFSNRFCNQLDSLALIRKGPYKAKGILKLQRNLLGLVIKRKKVWKNIFINKKKNSSPFLITYSQKLQGERLSTNIEEISMALPL